MHRRPHHKQDRVNCSARFQIETGCDSRRDCWCFCCVGVGARRSDLLWRQDSRPRSGRPRAIVDALCNRWRKRRLGDCPRRAVASISLARYRHALHRHLSRLRSTRPTREARNVCQRAMVAGARHARRGSGDCAGSVPADGRPGVGDVGSAGGVTRRRFRFHKPAVGLTPPSSHLSSHPAASRPARAVVPDAIVDLPPIKGRVIGSQFISCMLRHRLPRSAVIFANHGPRDFLTANRKEKGEARWRANLHTARSAVVTRINDGQSSHASSPRLRLPAGPRATGWLVCQKTVGRCHNLLLSANQLMKKRFPIDI